MELNEQQQKFVDIIQNLAKAKLDEPKIIILEGPAGTGKTTCLKNSIKGFKNQFILAPTGKAATRASFVCDVPGATIHSWLWKWEYLTELECWETVENSQAEIPNSKIIIIDEASMLSESIFVELKSFCFRKGLSIVFVGDPCQLPPVQIEDKNSTTNKSHFSIFSSIEYDEKIVLTEVHRQALDSIVLRCATRIRENKDLNHSFEGVRALKPEELVSEALNLFKEENGVLICHSNKLRKYLNEQIRLSLGFFTDNIEEGENIVITRNSPENNVFNGETFTVKEWISSKNIRIKTKNGPFLLSCQEVTISENKTVLIAKQENFLAKALPRGAPSNLIFYDHGYAMTCHKTQGSEYEKVLIAIEPQILKSSDSRKWLYTAVSRSKKDVSVCVVRNYFDKFIIK